MQSDRNPISIVAAPAKDDRLTLIAISVLAAILPNVLHEGLGHGVTAWLSGAHRITVSTVAMQCDIPDTRWIAANGTLVNLVFGAIFWLLLLKPQRYAPAVRYFLVLTMTGNLFAGTGYFFFSGITNFGDWAVVISGLQPHWLWQLGLFVFGVIAYFASMLLVRNQLLPFRHGAQQSHRIRALCFTPYVTDAILAALGGLLNPAGLFYLIASALPGTLGGNAGLLGLPGMIHGWTRTHLNLSAENQLDQVPPVPRSLPWILTAAIASLLFILVLGRGLTWSR
jgi:hypothetical protein